MQIVTETRMSTLWDLAEIVQEETERLYGNDQLAQRVFEMVLVRLIQNYVTNITIVE